MARSDFADEGNRPGSGAAHLAEWSLVGAARMRALDRYTIDKLGISDEVLMENAGRRVFDCVLDRLQIMSAQDRAVWVFCGPGNNGGDGFVVARLLRERGISVEAVQVGDFARVAGAAEKNRSRALEAGVLIREGDLEAPLRGLVVDAVFGTGLKRPLAGEVLTWVERIRAARSHGHVQVVAVDLPSGLDADTGQPLGSVLEADVTVTIGSPKVGLALEPGRSWAGQVWVAPVGIVDVLPDDEEVAPEAPIRLWMRERFLERLPERTRAGHKGTFGHVLMVAGSEGKTGAAALAAEGALRAGSGLVTLACPQGLNDILEVKCTETMTLPVGPVASRCFALESAPVILEASVGMNVVALGPGLGQAPETRSFVEALVTELGCPLVLDADGLNALGEKPECLRSRRQETVITPHPGEAARLLGVSAGAINRDRVGAARSLAAKTGAVVLLKGPATVCVDPEGQAIINPTGGPNLATAGTGDVLTGIVASLIGQGVEAFDAAAVAAWWHGRAADGLAQVHGTRGTLASEIAGALPQVERQLRGEEIRERGSDALLVFPDA